MRKAITVKFERKKDPPWKKADIAQDHQWHGIRYPV
jgi:hypothetical protein